MIQSKTIDDIYLNKNQLFWLTEKNNNESYTTYLKQGTNANYSGRGK